VSKVGEKHRMTASCVSLCIELRQLHFRPSFCYGRADLHKNKKGHLVSLAFLAGGDPVLCWRPQGVFRTFFEHGF
jgi:hypothetical protein